MTIELMHSSALYSTTYFTVQVKSFQQASQSDTCHFNIFYKFLAWSITIRGIVKCRLRTDCGLLFLGLENNGPIVVTYSFAW